MTETQTAADAVATTRPTLLEARDLHVEFSSRGRRARAVDGVNLAIGAGEIVALVGESGCGKTTLARTLLGLERPSSGEVRYDGDVLNYSSKALKEYRRQVQLVLQDPTGSLNPRHTVYEAVAEGARIHGMPDEQDVVTTALSRAGLRPPDRFFLRYPHELSGGQRQRVVISRRAGTQPEGPHRRRARGQPGRLRTRRDPGPAAQTTRRPGPLSTGRHP